MKSSMWKAFVVLGAFFFFNSAGAQEVAQIQTVAAPAAVQSASAAPQLEGLLGTYSGTRLITSGQSATNSSITIQLLEVKGSQIRARIGIAPGGNRFCVLPEAETWLSFEDGQLVLPIKGQRANFGRSDFMNCYFEGVIRLKDGDLEGTTTMNGFASPFSATKKN